MLHYALVFLIIALLAGAFGFFGIAGLAASIAKILFFLFSIWRECFGPSCKGTAVGFEMDSLTSDGLYLPRPLVYVGMCCDLIHHGHISLIKRARAVGNVMVGLLTDAAIATYKRPPLLSYEARLEIVREIKGVEFVVPQNTLSYDDNLLRYRPEFVMHGDDWKRGVQQRARERVIAVIEEWGGQLIEVSYTKGISSGRLRERLYI